jgi:hypothetical protein
MLDTREGDGSMPNVRTDPTADGNVTEDGIPSWVREAARVGMADTTSDIGHLVQTTVDETGNVTPIPVQAWYTPEMIGSLIGVQGQRIRQLVRKLHIGTKFGRQWLLTADDLRKLLSDRQPKESTTMSGKKTAQIVALEGLSHIASRIERAEKAHAELATALWALEKHVLSYDDRMNTLERKVMDCLEPKPRARTRRKTSE